MNKYGSIKNLHPLDPATDYKRYDRTLYSHPEFKMLQDIQWEMTEKIDGTNIRVIRDYYEDYPGSEIMRHKLKFLARTDKGQVPAFMLDRLVELFTLDAFAMAFDDDSPVCLYGEGFGARIGKGGGKYKSDGVDFALFDVKVGDLWLRREDVADIAENMGLQLVPTFGNAPLVIAEKIVSRGYGSCIPGADCRAEGLVLRPVEELFDRRGNRVIAKLKTEYYWGK